MFSMENEDAMTKVLTVFLIVVAGGLSFESSHALETYIPHITAGYADWTDYLQVDNDAYSDAVFTLTLYADGNQVYSQPFTLAGLGSSLINLKSLHAYAETGIITHTDPGLNFRVSYENTGGGLAEFKTMDTLGTAAGFYFSDFTPSMKHKGSAIANMGTSPVDVVLYAIGQDAIGEGAVLGTYETTIGARDKIIGVHTAWFPAIGFEQIKRIIAVTSSPCLSGIVICGDADLSHLLFTPAVPIEHIEITPPSRECGAYVAPGVWKQFDCYNLAAIGKTSGDDPFAPSWRLIGGYWQWGQKGPDSSQWHSTDSANFAHGPTGSDTETPNDGAITGWSSTYAPDGSWSDTSKTANDPCPSGFRVPTRSQWDGVVANNTYTTAGTWSSSATNYSSARFFGSELMLPAAGGRNHSSGSLFNRGGYGYYWSSSEYTSDYSSSYLYFGDCCAGTSDYRRGYGFPVRCVAE
jgi:uncharacterized protein (TIGR02145 family)